MFRLLCSRCLFRHSNTCYAIYNRTWRVEIKLEFATIASPQLSNITQVCHDRIIPCRRKAISFRSMSSQAQTEVVHEEGTDEIQNKTIASSTITRYYRPTVLNLYEDDYVEPEITVENFEKVYPRLRLPFKLSHQQNLEWAKRFTLYRVQNHPLRMSPIHREQYTELYEHLSGEQRSQVVEIIDQVVECYNRTAARTLFCPLTVSIDGR